MLTIENIKGLVSQELSLMSLEARELLEPFLIEPYAEMRYWEYEGMGDKQYPCWIIARYSPRRGAAYSQHGFGDPEYGKPWGLVDFTEDCYSQDGLWETTLERLVKHFSPLKYK